MSRMVKKKKAYRDAMREKVKSGKINNHDGLWISYDQSKAMHRDMKAGYRV